MFPIIKSGLVRYTKHFDAAIIAVSTALETGTITNPVYQDSKSMVNRALEEAWQALISTKYIYRRDSETFPPDVYDFYHTIGLAPEIHRIAGMSKKVQNTKLSHPMITDMRNFLTDALPLVEMFEKVKTKVVKRQPKPVEDRKEKYNAPAASMTAIGEVKRMLEQVTQDAFLSLVQSFEDYITRLFNNYMNAQKKSRADGEPLSLYDYYSPSRGKNYHPQGFDYVSKLVNLGTSRSAETKAKPNWKSIVTTEATKQAEHIREMFVYKNLFKLDSIIEAKGNFNHGEIVGHTVNMGSLEGTFRFFFTDGSYFTVKNSAVWSHSVYGKGFTRFPLTFHNVVMVDGSLMGQPSEARMNTVFVGKE